MVKAFFTNELGNTFASESSVSDSDGGEGLFLFLAKTQRRKGFLLAGSKKKKGGDEKKRRELSRLYGLFDVCLDGVAGAYEVAVAIAIVDFGNVGPEFIVFDPCQGIGGFFAGIGVCPFAARAFELCVR